MRGRVLHGLALRFSHTLEPWTGGWMQGLDRGWKRALGEHLPAATPARLHPQPQPSLSAPPSCTAPPPAEYMYRPLGDADPAVRKNTLMVLTHLILNDMMKARRAAGERSGWG